MTAGPPLLTPTVASPTITTCIISGSLIFPTSFESCSITSTMTRAHKICHGVPIAVWVIGGFFLGQLSLALSGSKEMFRYFSDVYKQTKILSPLDINTDNAELTLERNETAFLKAYDFAYSSFIEEKALPSCNRNASVTEKKQNCIPRKQVNFSTFPYKADGGLSDKDRQFLAELYYHSESTFEFGVGESTDIAAATNMPRYVGVDSSSEWIAKVRERAPHWFRFHFADVGPTRAWGYPTKRLKKTTFNYQIAPLFLERDSFDVYLVDGRFRVACAMASFLHAIHTGGDLSKTTVLIHDYLPDNDWRKYSVVKTVADTEIKGEKVLVLKLMPNITEAVLYDLWDVSYLCIVCSTQCHEMLLLTKCHTCLSHS